MRKLDAHTAREILDSAHNAWNRGDIEGVLAHYTDDVSYWCNAGSLDGTPHTIEGKQGLRTFLRSVTAVAESGTATEHFQFEDGVGRALVEAYIRHRRTGHILSGTYRQIITFKGRKIMRLEEYHDAAKMMAFWRMVTSDQPTEDTQEP